MRKRIFFTATVLYCAGCLFSQSAETITDGLIAAARTGNVVKLDRLLDGGADIDARNQYAETALMNAADAGKVETVKELLKRGAKIDLLNPYNRSAFFFAAFMRHEEAALELLNAGAAFDVPDRNGCTALMTASLGGMERLVKALLEKGADVHAKSRLGNALFLAAKADNLPIVRALLEKGADVNVPGEMDRGEGAWTALHCATWNGDVEMIRLLVRVGADLNAVRTRGMTPLMEVAGFNEPIEKSLEMVEFLLDAGADINLEDFHGDTALTIAGQKGRTEVVQFLAHRGAKKKEVRINVSPYPVLETLPAEKRWILACTAILTQLNRSSHEMLGGFPQKYGEQAKATLRKWWDVHDRDEALDTLDRLQLRGTRFDYAEKINTSPERLLAWDYCRYLFVCGQAYAAGYFTEQEAWDIATPIASKLQHSFHSWKEMGESYLLGRKIWGAKDEAQGEVVFQLLLNPDDPNSPWNTVSWDTSLLPLITPKKIGNDPVFNEPMTLKLNPSHERKPSP